MRQRILAFLLILIFALLHRPRPPSHRPEPRTYNRAELHVPSPNSTIDKNRYKSPTANPARPAPEWNTIEVECTGPRITVRLSGQTVLEADQSELADVKIRPAGVPAPKNKPRSGYVALQSHSGRVEFRNAQIRES